MKTTSKKNFQVNLAIVVVFVVIFVVVVMFVFVFTAFVVAIDPGKNPASWHIISTSACYKTIGPPPGLDHTGEKLDWN